MSRGDPVTHWDPSPTLCRIPDIKSRTLSSSLKSVKFVKIIPVRKPEDDLSLLG